MRKRSRRKEVSMRDALVKSDFFFHKRVSWAIGAG
jgi:hypothetical protein